MYLSYGIGHENASHNYVTVSVGASYGKKPTLEQPANSPDSTTLYQ